jgi:hypothetical protein
MDFFSSGSEGVTGLCSWQLRRTRSQFLFQSTKISSQEHWLQSFGKANWIVLYFSDSSSLGAPKAGALPETHHNIGGRSSIGAFSPSAFCLSQSHGEHGGVSEFPRVSISATTSPSARCLLTALRSGCPPGLHICLSLWTCAIARVFAPAHVALRAALRQATQPAPAGMCSREPSAPRPPVHPVILSKNPYSDSRWSANFPLRIRNLFTIPPHASISPCIGKVSSSPNLSGIFLIALNSRVY